MLSLSARVFIIFFVNGKIIEEDENIIFNVHEGKHIKTQSTRKLSNFNFEWTKNLSQNNLKHVAFFFNFSRTKYVKSHFNNTKKNFLREGKKLNVTFHRIKSYT